MTEEMFDGDGGVHWYTDTGMSDYRVSEYIEILDHIEEHGMAAIHKDEECATCRFLNSVWPSKGNGTKKSK